MLLSENEVWRLIERASDYDGSMSKTYFAQLVEEAVMKKIQKVAPDLYPAIDERISNPIPSMPVIQ